MPKLKITKLVLTCCCLCGYICGLHAQNTLEAVIDRTKQQKQRELAPPFANSPAEVAKQAERTANNKLVLWSLSGVNNDLVAEIWYGEVMHHVPLKVDERLPSGWKVKSFDKQSITLIRGKQTKKLTVAPRGSSGWEFPQVQNTVVPAGSEVNSTAARAAASTLPPAAMPPSQQNLSRPND